MKSVLLKDSYVFASLPVLAFVVAFIFEMGYADAFGYDYYFIELDLKAMVVALVCVIVVLLPLALFLYVFLYALRSDSKSPRVMGLSLMYPVVSMCGFYITGFQSTVLKWLLAASLCYLAFVLARLFVKARLKGWEDALNEYADTEGVPDRRQSAQSARPLGVRDYLLQALVVLLFLLATLFMIRGIGFGVAHWKTNYSVVIIDNEEYALLAVYGDNFVAGGVHDDKFNNKVSLVSKGSDTLKDVRSAHFTDFISSGLWLR